ncbi:MAG: hypothetical protein M3450_08195, partial [Actinomycetota bacterium]|nr:hypothetical protein [Actinomycetota bacterium]
MASSEEDVPRFSLRRGARFLETLRDEPESEDTNEGWLADLGEGRVDDPGQVPATLEYGPVNGEADPSGQPVHAVDQPAPEAVVAPETVGDQPEPEIARHRRFGGVQIAEDPGEFEATGAPVEDPGALSYKTRLRELAALTFGATPPAGHVSEPRAEHQPALADALATLAERLTALEEAMTRTAAACTAARMVLSQGQAVLAHPSNTPGSQASGNDTAVV